jgi:hypothetical protein
MEEFGSPDSDAEWARVRRNPVQKRGVQRNDVQADPHGLDRQHPPTFATAHLACGGDAIQ